MSIFSSRSVRSIHRLSRITGFVLCAVFALAITAMAAPPSITSYTFTEGTQTIAVTANSGGILANYTISSSSANTTFNPTTVAGAFTGTTNLSWVVDPGGAAIGQTHTFTLVITNTDGSVLDRLCLEVVSAGQYSETQCDAVPTIGTVGILVLLVLLVAGAAIVLRKRLVRT